MEYARLVPGRGFLPVHSLLYYSQRLLTARRLRNLVVAMVRTGIRLKQGECLQKESLTSEESIHLASLRASGFTPLGPLLNERQLEEIHAFLQAKELTGRQKASGSFTLDTRSPDVRMADYSLNDVVVCPHILELANKPLLLRLAAHYLGCKPTISALGLRWSFPGEASRKDVQAFHRDSEDWRYFKVFVYLTDVDLESGPHVYVRGTHTDRAPIRLRFYGNDEILKQYGVERMATVTGQKGFGFAADTAGIHKGEAPTRSPRLMLQIQYSMLPAYAYRYQARPYRGSLDIDRYINRLFLA